MTNMQQTNAALMARRRQAIPRGVGQSHEVFIDHAKNAEIWDVEGQRYIDFAGGIAVLNTGHLHPAVVAAVKEQLCKYSHTCFQVVAYEPYIALAEKLNALAPGVAPKKTVFFTSGAEALENAVKIARAYTGRPGVIAFAGGYHGRTHMALALTGKVAPYKVGFGPFPSDVFHALFPSERHGISVAQALQSVECLLANDVEATRVAAIVLEPVQGEGGFHIAPVDFVQGLRKMADEHGILLIADEVQTGAGRTGTFYACEQWPVVPDLIATAKSLAGGFPLSGVIGRADIMDAPIPGGLGGTYAGSPVALVAALAVLETFEKEQLLTRSQAIGQRLVGFLQNLAAEHPVISDVRGLGAMVAFELSKGGDVRQPDAPLTKRLIAEAAARKLVLLSCGTQGNVVRILVPLTASDALIDEGLRIIAQSLSAAQA